LTLVSGDAPFRVLPQLTDHNRDFWTAGARGELRLWRCGACGYYIHPWQPLCPECHSKKLATEAVSGSATLASYTINHQRWMPGPELPYVVAIVEIAEQPSLRLTTNLVGCAHDRIRIGMPVRVVFERHADPDGDVYLPLFEPEAA
jgi:uncharacterized OB-fold protein